MLEKMTLLTLRKKLSYCVAAKGFYSTQFLTLQCSYFRSVHFRSQYYSNINIRDHKVSRKSLSLSLDREFRFSTSKLTL